MVEKPSVMRGESTGWKPGPIGIVCSAIIAIGFLLLVTRLPPSTRPPSSGEEPLASTPRQQVVIFIVDTSDYFDAHGTYVQSVIRQRCPLCEVRQVNLHGDFSIPTLLRALQHVLKISQAFDPTTTTLVNLSLGTYVYDSVFHAMVRSLEAQRVIMIASAGNDNTARPFYPAAFQEVLGICASTRYTKAKATYSNFGSWVGLCAPGLHYVKRPLRQGALATGTSFASPMVTGVLGQLLIDTPCVSPRVGLRALQRTADPAVEHQQYLGAGLLNPGAAASYLRSLYPCQRSAGFFKSLLTRVQRLGTGVATYVGLILYFFVSIFALPFLLAFSIERYQRRGAQRQQHAVHMAYTGSPDYRRQRLLAIKERFQCLQKVRRGDQTELFALLHALHVHGEPCWWCDRPETEPLCEGCSDAPVIACSRCGIMLHDSTSS